MPKRAENIFVNIQNIIELENANKWEESVLLIEKHLLNNETDEKLLLRLLLQCWYVINVVYSTDDYDINEYDTVSKKYIHYMKLYLNNKSNSCYSDLLVGYILSTVPTPFEPYEQWEQLGFQLIESAYSKNSQSLIFQKIYYGSKLQSYNDLDCNQLHYEIELTFPNESAVEKYFQEVLW